MAERLVVLSDMWGAKKGLWITSYLGYLQQYFNITFYDCQQLANIDLTVDSGKNIHTEFVNGGIEAAASHLMVKEHEPAHYLAFSTGGTIAWKAALKGLPMKSLYAVSATRIRMEDEKPDIPVTLIYGDKDQYRPSDSWFDNLELEKELISNFGHELYSDEKIIQKVSLDLLNNVLQKQLQL